MGAGAVGRSGYSKLCDSFQCGGMVLQAKRILLPCRNEKAVESGGGSGREKWVFQLTDAKRVPTQRQDRSASTFGGSKLKRQHYCFAFDDKIDREKHRGNPMTI